MPPQGVAVLRDRAHFSDGGGGRRANEARAQRERANVEDAATFMVST
jgi:hypothetical protein